MIATVLTIAGSDSSGGAGIQADLKAIAANGAYGASVVTAITAQNTVAVTLAEALPSAWIRAQIDAVFSDLDVRAVKSGMLASREVIRTVAAGLAAHHPACFVCDPVMIAKGGHPLLAADAVAALREEIVPLADLVTPNVHEARALAELPELRSVADARAAGQRILAFGAKAVLVKGGHLAEAPSADVLVTAQDWRVFEGEWVDSIHTHGTGCTYSAAIATWLARGRPLPEAIGRAKEFIAGAIRAGLQVGRGIGPTDPFYFLGGRESPAGEPGGRAGAGTLHVLTDETIQARHTHVELARHAAEGGADAVQLREKRPWTTARWVRTAQEMAAAVAGSGARVVVNDRVDVALAAGIDAVHLGAQDLEPGAARRILGPLAWVGATAHNVDEAVRAASLCVDYLGVGPVFGTTSKPQAPPPLGLPGLAAIVGAVKIPVVAIGSITVERVADVMATGAAGIAVLGAVVADADPARATRRLREALDACRVRA